MLSEFYNEEDGKYWPEHAELKRVATRVGEQVLESGIVVVNLVGVTRGGLIPMGYISRIVNWGQTETIDMNSYHRNSDGTESPGIMSITKKPVILHPEGEGALFIDDVAETAGTAKKIKQLYPLAKMAVMYSKIPEDELYGLVDYVGEYTEHRKAWIEFPWEV